ncbi:cadherin domain protein [Dictyocaulus viviparus]|uniref:Cadherin domain protein n=1 Tax=Dictyocaulus viviparus TaxID=29172 RepID=A0A0D8XMZ9_DICVI|nr:cadherin domain protein [Dictyocaulus viviparus]
MTLEHASATVRRLPTSAEEHCTVCELTVAVQNIEIIHAIIISKTSRIELPEALERQSPETSLEFGLEPLDTLSSQSHNDIRSLKRVQSKDTLVIPLNDSSTRFEHCVIRVAMPENSAVGSHVTTLSVLNKKDWTLIDMVNPDGTFDIRQDSGEVYIRDNRIMDRELFTNLELVVEIHGSSHRTKCARARVTVELLDENDNRPTFEKDRYVFWLSETASIGTVVGVVRARDIDEGEAGRVSYRFINDSSMFSIREKGKDAEIVTSSSLQGFTNLVLIVEASDHAPPFLASQIPVHVVITSSELQSSGAEAGKPTINGVALIPQQPLDFSMITESSSTEEFLKTAFTTMPSISRRSWLRKKSSRRTINELNTSTLYTTSSLMPKKADNDMIHAALVSNKSLSEEDKRTPAFVLNRIEDEERHLSMGVDRGNRKNPKSNKSSSLTNFDPCQILSEDICSPISWASTSEFMATSAVISHELTSFSFVEPSYYFEIFGIPQEGDIMGRVEAYPHAQMYAIDRKISEKFKIDPDLGELSVGRNLRDFGGNNISFEVSATDGVRTVVIVCTGVTEQEI